MPLVAHNDLPTYSRLQQEGLQVLPHNHAIQQDIRELNIGLLNMMPDAALEATERQFCRLIGEANQIAQFHMHPFTLDALPRGEKAAAHIERYYETFDDLREKGLDALIITGANVTHPNLADEPFWGPLSEVIDWAMESVTSTLCSCLATHAVLQFRHGERRVQQEDKRWGVFSHRVMDRTHPLVADVNTRFDVPHSRFNDISREQFDRAGLRVLVESEEAGVHLAVSQDGLRVVYFQGHPEYDTVSLLKEYKREVMLFARGARKNYPPLPDNYLTQQAAAILDEYCTLLKRAMAQGKTLPQFPESLLMSCLDNTWHDTAEAVMGNWVGKVYLVTDHDRKVPFMPGIDPNNPLGLSTI